MTWQSTVAGTQARGVANSKNTSWITRAPVPISVFTNFREPSESVSHTKLMVKVFLMPGGGAGIQKDKLIYFRAGTKQG